MLHCVPRVSKVDALVLNPLGILLQYSIPSCDTLFCPAVNRCFPGTSDLPVPKSKQILLKSHDQTPRRFPLYALPQRHHLQRLLAIKIPRKSRPCLPLSLLLKPLPDRFQIQTLRHISAIRILDYFRLDAQQMLRGVGRRRVGLDRLRPPLELLLVRLRLFVQAVQASFLGGRLRGHRCGGGGERARLVHGVFFGVVVGALDALLVEGVVDFVADLGPHDDEGEGAEAGDPAVAQQPGEHLHVLRAVGLGGGEGLVRAGREGEEGEERGERGGQRECCAPCCAGRGERVIGGVGGDDVGVAGVEGWDGDGAAVVD